MWAFHCCGVFKVRRLCALFRCDKRAGKVWQVHHDLSHVKYDLQCMWSKIQDKILPSFIVWARKNLKSRAHKTG